MGINNEHGTLAYADEIVVLGEIKEEVINTTSKLIYASKKNETPRKRRKH